MTYALEEGFNVPVSEALAGNCYSFQGTKLNFSTRPNTTNCYIASAAYNDGTGRFRDYWFDHVNSNAVYETVHISTR
jgi:hypothetical protein